MSKFGIAIEKLRTQYRQARAMNFTRWFCRALVLAAIFLARGKSLVAQAADAPMSGTNAATASSVTLSTSSRSSARLRP